MTSSAAPPVAAAPLEAWRIYFPTAALLGVGGLVAWSMQLGGVPLGILPRDHGAFMAWGVLGTGIQGFLLTAYPKQNDAPAPGRRFLLALLTLQVAAAVALLAGQPSLAPLPWAVLVAWSVDIAQPSLRRKWDATTAAVPPVLLSGLVGSVVHAAGGAGTAIGVHAFVLPMALAVLDRVLPFFSSRVLPTYAGRRLPWFLGPVLVASWMRATAYPRLGAGILLALLLRQVWGWQPWPASRTPMIVVLHLGVAWIAASWVLTLGGATPSVVTHALAIGGLGSLLFGVSMRVVRGHSGLPIVLGKVGALVLLFAQVAVVLRVSGVALPAAAAALAGAFALWLLGFGRVSWRGSGRP